MKKANVDLIRARSNAVNAHDFDRFYERSAGAPRVRDLQVQPGARRIPDQRRV